MHSLYIDCKYGHMIDIGVQYVGPDHVVEPIACIDVKIYTQWLLDQRGSDRDLIAIAKVVAQYTEVRCWFYEYLLPFKYGLHNQVSHENHKNLSKEVLFEEIKNNLYNSVTAIGLGFSED